MLPRNIAMELALTGDPIAAERGYELGLVNRLTEPGGALDAALELAERSPPTGRWRSPRSKRILHESVDWPDAEFFERQAAISEPIFALRGRPRGRDRVRREARAGLEGALGLGAGRR